MASRPHADASPPSLPFQPAGSTLPTPPRPFLFDRRRPRKYIVRRVWGCDGWRCTAAVGLGRMEARFERLGYRRDRTLGLYRPVQTWKERRSRAADSSWTPPPTPLSSLVTPLPPHVHDRLTSLSDGVRPSLMSKRAVRLGEFRCSDAMLVQPAPRARASSRHS
jgi:hypothetical protein